MDIQWSLYFKTTHATKKMWSYIEGHLTQKGALWDQISGLIIKCSLKIEGCKIEGLL